MPPVNPAAFYVNPSERVEFRYEPGRKLYYVIARSTSHVLVSLLLMANDKDHVHRILSELCDFWQDCDERYVEYQRNLTSKTHPGIEARMLTSRKRRHLLRDLLACRACEYVLEIGQADLTQLYKVGWAYNDTLT